MYKWSEGGPAQTPAKRARKVIMHDKQNERDDRELRIDKVGVRGLRFPIQIRDKAHSVQNTIAMIGMFVDLPKEFKGTHMSRFIEVLNAHGGMVHVENIPDILYAMQKKLKSTSAHLEMEFGGEVPAVAGVGEDKVLAAICYPHTDLPEAQQRVLENELQARVVDRERDIGTE